VWIDRGLMLASPVGLLYIFAPFYKDLARFSRAREKKKKLLCICTGIKTTLQSLPLLPLSHYSSTLLFLSKCDINVDDSSAATAGDTGRFATQLLNGKV
jgi:hypothetical protein